MSSPSPSRSQLDELVEEKSQLDASIKKMRLELSQLGVGKSDPAYRKLKSDTFFLVERRAKVRDKIRYRRTNDIENAGPHKMTENTGTALIEELSGEIAVMGVEITRLRAQLTTERNKAPTEKREVLISQLEDSLASLVKARNNISNRICYHRKKLKK